MTSSAGRQFEKVSAGIRAMARALEINSTDFRTYGTFAEIGAGLETSRFFFQAGKASSTVAKAMSAYAKEASDIIYLDDEYQELLKREVDRNQDGSLKLREPKSFLPYTSRFRVKKMLHSEYKLLVDRFANQEFAAAIQDERRRSGSTISTDFPAFFVYANSVSVSNWGREADRCFGWVGARVQMRRPSNRPLTWESARRGGYVDILAHVVMLEESREEQMDTLGIFGVQLLDVAIKLSEEKIINRSGLLNELRGDIDYPRFRVDAVDVSTGSFGTIKAAMDEEYSTPKLAYDMVDYRLTHSVLLARSKQPELVGIRGPIAECIRKKGEMDYCFSANHQKVPQRFFSRSHVIIHKLPLNDAHMLDKERILALVDANWGVFDGNLEIRHVFVGPLALFKDDSGINRFNDVASEFLEASAGSAELISLMLVRYDDPAWLLDRMCRFTFERGRVHLALTAADFVSLLNDDERTWRERDGWLDYTDSDERLDSTIKRNSARGVRIWSQSTRHFLLRVMQRPVVEQDKKGVPSDKQPPMCCIRIRDWDPQRHRADIPIDILKLLDFMEASGRVIFIEKKSQQPSGEAPKP